MTHQSSAAAAAAAIAARLAAQLKEKGQTAAPLPAQYEQGPPLPNPDEIKDPVAKARAIAARLAVGIKRKQEESGDFAWGSGEGSKKRKKIYIPINQHPEINYMGLLIGPKGATSKRLETESGARIFIRGRGAAKEGIPSADDNDDLHVLIVADTDDSVARAERLVNDILFNPEAAQRLKQEQFGTGANAIGHGYGPSPGGGDPIEVPNSLVGYVIGKGGENIRDIQARTGTHIQVQRENEMAPGQTTRVITVTGPPDGVRIAIESVLSMVRQRQQELAMQGVPVAGAASVNLTLAIPNDRVGIVIGKAGMTIKAIQMRTGAHVQIPKEPDATNPGVRTITIAAPTESGAQAAQAEVLALVNNDASAAQGLPPGYASTMQVPNDRIGSVIGRAGAVIREIQTRTGTRIQVPTEPDPGSNPPVRTVSIMGNPAGCEQAKVDIQNLLAAGPNKSSGSGGAAYGYGGYANPYAAWYGGYGDPGAVPNGGATDPWAAYYAQMAGTGAAVAAATAAVASPEPADAAAAAGQPTPEEAAEAWRKYYEYYGYAYPGAAGAAGSADSSTAAAADGTPLPVPTPETPH